MADDYYKQYHAYILANEDELFDMFLENMPGFEPYRPIMKNDLKSAMNKDRFLLNDNEPAHNASCCANHPVMHNAITNDTRNEDPLLPYALDTATVAGSPKSAL